MRVFVGVWNFCSESCCFVDMETVLGMLEVEVEREEVEKGSFGSALH
jgi:hypothetical protein